METRIQELEERLAWQERQLSELDSVVRELADEVARLRRELSDVQQLTAPVMGPADERPPHY